MGVCLLRAIEVKVNNKWRLIDIPTTKKEYYDLEKDEFQASEDTHYYVDEEGKTLSFYKSYYNEASLLIRDNVFGWGQNNLLKDKVGLPSDICEDIKKIVPKDAWCVNLDDWKSFIKVKRKEFEQHLEEYYHKKEFIKLNLKLDHILEGYNKEQSDKLIIKAEEDNEIPEYEDLLYMKDDIWETEFYSLIDYEAEHDWIYNILYDIYESWPDVRIYYWMD